MRFYTYYTNRRHNTYGASCAAGYGSQSQGWNAGAKVVCHGDKDEPDSFSVYMTSGSSGHQSDRLLGIVHDTPDGPHWEPAEGNVPTTRVEIREVQVPAPAPARSADEDSPGIARAALHMAIDALTGNQDPAYALDGLRAELARLDGPRITTTPSASDDMEG